MKADKLTTEIGDIIENVWAKYGGDEWIDVAAARVVKHLRREYSIVVDANGEVHRES